MRLWHRVTLVLLALSAGALVAGGYLPWATIRQAPGTLLLDGAAVDYQGGQVTLTGVQLVAEGLATHTALLVAILAACTWRGGRLWWIGLGLVVLGARTGLTIPTPDLAGDGVRQLGTGVGLTVARIGWAAGLASGLLAVWHAVDRRATEKADAAEAAAETARRAEASRLQARRLSPDWYAPSVPAPTTPRRRYTGQK